jgi:hypothetical protein
MANGLGQIDVDFGVFPGTSETSVAVTGQGSISASSKAEAYIMGDDTTTGTGAHTAADHRYAPCFIGLSCGTPTAGVGFTIHARCLDKMQGKFSLRWVWTD